MVKVRKRPLWEDSLSFEGGAGKLRVAAVGTFSDVLQVKTKARL